MSLTLSFMSDDLTASALEDVVTKYEPLPHTNYDNNGDRCRQELERWRANGTGGYQFAQTMAPSQRALIGKRKVP